MREKMGLLELLGAAAAATLANPRRPASADGRPGGLVELPSREKIIIVGDIHASVESFEAILLRSGALADIEAGSATLVFLGDIVQDDRPGRLGDMEGSLEILMPLCRLLASHPDRVVWLRGNHDSFDPDLTKGGVCQGRLFRAAVEERGGAALREAIQDLFDALPLVAAGGSLILVHAGPPRGGMRRDAIVGIRRDSDLANEMVWNRIGAAPAEPGYYCIDDLRASFAGLGLGEAGTFIVGHNPLWTRGDGSGLWSDVGIAGHHILYSGGLGEAPWLCFEDGILVSRLARPWRSGPRESQARFRPRRGD